MNKSILLLSLMLSLFAASAATCWAIGPTIAFTDPTPGNGTQTAQTSVFINITLNHPTLDTFLFNWDGTNIYTVSDPSLVAGYNFNNNGEAGDTDNNAADFSENGNDGTISGAVYASGKYGKALEFDGVDDVVSLPFSSDVFTDQYTLEAWAYPTKAGSGGYIQGIISNDNPSSNGISLDFGQTSNLVLCIWRNETGWRVLYDTASLNTWHHVACVYDSTAINLYIDGVLTNTSSASGNVKAPTTDFKIGYDDTYQDTLDYFGGKIDNVRIYNHALSSGEIAVAYNSQFQIYENITGLADGTYTYYAFANNSAGTPITTDVRVLTVNTNPAECGGETACECGDTVVEDATLTGELNCAGDALTIGDDGITLDCDSYTISGDTTGIGVKINGLSGVTVQNCNINEFQTGINVSESDSVTVQNSNITVNGVIIADASGVHFEHSSNSQVIASYISYNDYGVYILASDNITVSDNTIEENWYDGIYIEGEGGPKSNHTITGNDVTGNCNHGNNACAGIHLVDEDRCLIQNNNVLDNDYHGILLVTSNNNQILSNDISSNGWAGVIITSPTDAALGGYNNVTGNTLTNNDRIGIATKTSNNRFIDNTISVEDGVGTYLYGIDLRRTGGVYPENNILSGNNVSDYEYGLNVWSGVVNFTVYGDSYHDNDYGVWLNGVGSEETYPSIVSCEIYNNTLEGMHLASSSIAGITDTDFQDNEVVGPLTGLYVDSSSTAWLVNGNFINNNDYAIYHEAGGDSVYWVLTEDVYCTNNNIAIGDIGGDSYIVPVGGKIISDDCTITVNGVEFDTANNQTGTYVEPVNEGTPFGGSDKGVEADIHTTGEAYSGDLTVNFYDSNPTGDSGFYSEEFGAWIDASLDPVPADLEYWILKIYYTDDQLAASGLDEDELSIEYYNATAGTWEIFDADHGNGGVNMDDNYVWANITHFSVFGIYGSTASSSSGSPTHYTLPETQCDARWTCTAWGTCVNGFMTRTCTATNDCEVLTGKPDERQTCTVGEQPAAPVVPEVKAPVKQTQQPPITPPSNLWAYLLIGVVIAAIIISAVALSLKKKK